MRRSSFDIRARKVPGRLRCDSGYVELEFGEQLASRVAMVNEAIGDPQPA